MNQKKINFIKGILLIVIFSGVLLLMDHVLMYKSKDGIEQMRSFYKQKENTVDVIFLGSSRMYCQVDTGILWDNYGISSFDLGGAEAPSWVSYYYLKEALKTQKPKVIFYETTIASYRKDVTEQNDNWAIINNYGFHLNNNRIEQLKNNTTGENFKKLLFPLGSTHNNYNQITKDSFLDSANSINNKGFDSRETVMSFDTPDIFNVTDCEEINEKHIIYLDKMKELADEYNIPFIVTVTPYVISEQEQKYLNYVFRHCEETGIHYLDMNKMYDEIGFDFETDMAEDIHVNMSGSKKLSEFFGKYISSNYNVEDHRGDKNYSSWDVDALYHRQDRQRYVLENPKDDNELFDAMINENYIVYITIGFQEEGLNDYEKGLFARAGIIGDLLKPRNAMIIDPKGNSFISEGEGFEVFTDDNDVKLLFRREHGYADSELLVDNEQYVMNIHNKASIIIYDRVLKKVIKQYEISAW